MRDAKGLVRVTVLAGMALMTASSAVRIAVAQEKGGGDVTGPYDYVSDWPLPLHVDGWTWGSIPAVWAESEDRVLVFMRGEKPAMKAVPAQGDIKGRALGLLEGVLEQGRQKGRLDEHVLMVFDRRGKLIDSWAQNKDLFTEGAAHRPASVSRRRSRSAISTVSALHSQVAHKLGCRPRGAPPFYGACAKISFF